MARSRTVTMTVDRNVSNLNRVQDEAPNFSLAPALAQKGILDYSTPLGIKVYQSGVDPINRDQPFDCEPLKLRAFLTGLKGRATSMGWSNILDIPVNEEGEENKVDLTQKYGERTINQIKEHVEPYLFLEDRKAQDSAQLYNCLMQSLTNEGLAKITIWQDEYTLRGVASGPLLLKIIIRERATSTQMLQFEMYATNYPT